MAVRLKSSCVVACAAWLVAGCSFLFTRGPKNDKDDDCSTSYVPPVLDTVNLIGELVFVAIAASGTQTPFQRVPGNRSASIALGVGFIALDGASATYGYATVGKCRSQRKRLALEEERAQIPVSPPVPRGWSAPPEGAAGFNFGATVADARQICIGAGHRWTTVENAHSCSGAATPLGQSAASLYLVFCAERLCRIDIVVPLAGKDARAAAAIFGELRKEITRRYGLPIHSNVHVPDECKAESAFLRCLAQGQARGDLHWQWPTGHSVTLEIFVDPAGQPVVGARFGLPGSAPPPRPPPARPPAVEPSRAQPDAGASTGADGGAVAPAP